jgi:hypothetical protein
LASPSTEHNELEKNTTSNSSCSFCEVLIFSSNTQQQQQLHNLRRGPHTRPLLHNELKNSNSNSNTATATATQQQQQQQQQQQGAFASS